MTAKCQHTTNTDGNPAPSTIALARSCSCRLRRATAGTSDASCCVASESAVTFSLKVFPGRLSQLLELRGDELVQVDHLTQLLVLVHELRIGPGPLHEFAVD